MLICILLAAGVTTAPPDARETERRDDRVVAAHAVGLLGGMRVGAALLWPADYGPAHLRSAPAHLREAFTRAPELRAGKPLFETDGDPWAINVFGHAAFGSEIYLRARQCGSTALRALAWTAGASVAWEYGFEATAKRPSAVDLTWTPLSGFLLGELRFRMYRWLGPGDGGALRWLARGVLDPLGSLERAAGAAF